MKSIAASFAAATLALAATTAAAGSVAGSVTVAGGQSGTTAVVYVEAIPGATFAPPTEPAVMDQRDMHFVPHVLPILVGTTVDFENHDTVAHNVFSPDSCAGSFNLGTWDPGGVRSHTFDQPCKAVILCAIHPDMEAWIAVLPTPYFATTDANGEYAIDTLPDGQYTISAWYPGMKVVSRKVAVSGTTAVDFEVRK